MHICLDCCLVLARQLKATGRHKLLDVDGIAAPGEIASPGEILINKLVPMSTKDPLPPNMTSLPLSNYKPAPVSWKGPPGESCIVDKVLLTQNDDGHNVIKASTLCPPHVVLRPRPGTCWLASTGISCLEAKELTCLVQKLHLQV